MTLGLRYEPFLTWRDTWRPELPQVAAFIPGQQSRVFPNIGEGINFFGDPGVSDRLADFHHKNIASISYVWELPRLEQQNPVVRAIFGNWQNNGIIRLQSGEFASVGSSFGNSLTGIGQDRADAVGTPKLSSDRPRGEAIREWFNTSAFVRNPEGTFGTSGRNIIETPGFANVDFSLFKNIPIRESVRLQFRSEFFNIFNRVNFNRPNTNVDSGAFGRITSARGPRIIQFQFALKLIF